MPTKQKMCVFCAARGKMDWRHRANSRKIGELTNSHIVKRLLDKHDNV